MGHCRGQVDTVHLWGLPLHSRPLPSGPWKADPSEELFKPVCLFSCAVLMQTAQGYPSCAEVCRSLGSYEMLTVRQPLCPCPPLPVLLLTYPSGPGSVFHPLDPSGWHKDKQ